MTANLIDTFKFAENSGPFLMEIDFSDVLSEEASLGDYELHAHFKKRIDDELPVLAVSSVAGSFVVSDADLKLAEISIPIATVQTTFPGCDTWLFDILMIERSEDPENEVRINAGLFQLITTKAVTRNVT